jgi:pyruvate dehydrogenase E2 component (dihydrolipoamide acetyltransferase)
MEQGTFVGWLKKSGEQVHPGDALFTLEGEKAIQEIEAVDSGLLHIDATNPAEGDIVAVGSVIGYLLAAGETAPPIPSRPIPSAPPQRESIPSAVRGSLRSPQHVRQVENPPPASPAVRRLARQLGVDLVPLTSAGRISEADVCRRYLQSRGEFLPSVVAAPPVIPSAPAIRSSVVPRRSRNLPTISPRAARSAARLGVDWTQLPGTGSQGRIRERDVLAVGDNLVAPPLSTSSTTRAIPITPLRRTIANRMVTSLQRTAPVTLTTQVDVSSLVEFRERLKQSGESLIPSLTDCFVKLTALALCEHPVLNARWRDDAIELIDDIHIGIAVDTNAGLLVPVVRDAQRRTVFEIASQSRSLIEQARARRLTPQELQGGTFTITNLGSLDIDAFTPIINFPETAILGLGRIQTQAATPTADSARTRQTMTLSLTFDHRVLDGAPAARFLQTLTRLAASDLPSLFEPPTHC